MRSIDVWDDAGCRITLKATATPADVLTAFWRIGPSGNTYMAPHRRAERVSRMHAAYRARNR